MTGASLDAVVVGAGPNGLTAAVMLARAGLRVLVYEAADTVGGGTRTEALTLPGFRHDVCSAVHPFAIGSPALRELPLAEHGLEWLHPEVPLAHPMPDGTAAVLTWSVDETAQSLGVDGSAYRKLMKPFQGRWWDLAPDVLRPLIAGLPDHPTLLARFGALALQPASRLLRRFQNEHARTLLGGLAAHAIAPLDRPCTSGVALLLALAGHDVGWPVPRGGSQAIADALVSYLGSLDGELVSGTPIRSLAELPPARAYVFDVMPRDLVAIAGDDLPSRYTRALHRYRHGPSVFKVDYALSGPVPWTADACRRAGTVHVGSPSPEITRALAAVAGGAAPNPPFLVVAQPSVFDSSRAPDGKHVLWTYAHVPARWDGDLHEAIEGQLERFAPGFRDLVLARSTIGPRELEAGNRSYIGGDISGGAFSGRQALFRPVVSRVPYATPNPAIFLCSSATPPGPGVHGMCGAQAARVALRRRFS